MSSTFKSEQAAVKYYEPYGYNTADVRNKVKHGEINIGGESGQGYWNEEERWIKEYVKIPILTDPIELINNMQADGNRLLLSEDKIDNYEGLKRILLKAGGKYKNGGFEFLSDAAKIQERLVKGEEIDDKKKYQFYETVDTIAEEMVNIAMAGRGAEGTRLLEPEAGAAAILKYVPKECDITAVELWGKNIGILIDMGYSPIHSDFLTLTEEDLGLFDVIVANPPFTNNQDIDHIKHMYELLDAGGIMVSLSSPSWSTGSQKKQVEFRDWLEEVNAEVRDIEGKTFRESGTDTETKLITIKKCLPFP